MLQALCRISIHSLRVEGDDLTRPLCVFHMISIHSLRVEGDKRTFVHSSICPNFNPLPPRGGRLFSLLQKLQQRKFQSTPSAWRETRPLKNQPHSTDISIHPLRVEGDKPDEKAEEIVEISIHSLRVEGDI